MGFASYLEDVRKIREDAGELRRLLDNEPGAAPQEVDRRIRSYCAVLDGVVSRFDKLLAIATDPDVVLADEVAMLKTQRDQTVAETEGLRSQLAASEAARRWAAERLDVELATQKKLVARLKKEKRETDRKFDALARQNFAAAVEIYPARPKGD
jgi:hypothetical protein